MGRVTPMLKQYRELKARYPDALVLYRLGDFYELFEADAELASRQLGLVLTSRRFAKNVSLPMCGIPHHRLTSYLARLIRLGHKVAIVEQLEDARKTNRLVKRDVVRVITPGTVVEDALLRESEQNLLVGIVTSSVAAGDRRQARSLAFGLAAIDLSTGEFAATQIDGPDAESACWEELACLNPSEIVAPRSLVEDPAFKSQLDAIPHSRLSPLDDVEFTVETAGRRLKAHLGVTTLEGFGCDRQPLSVAAAGGVLCYLQDNQISDLAHVVRLATYSLSTYVTIDATTYRNLELLRTLREGRQEGSLYETMNRTSTAMGARLLRRWLTRPLLDLDTIRGRQGAVRELVDDAILRGDLRSTLHRLYDVERLVGRIGFGTANARDLVALRQALERVPRIKALLANVQSTLLRRLDAQLDADTLSQVARLVAEAIVDDPPMLLREGGLIRPDYEEKLEQLRRTAAAGRDWLAEFEARERERTGIKNLRVRYNQVFGFFIEVTKTHLDKVPAEYERRATVRHAERFVTPALKAHEIEITNAEERIKQIEYDLFCQVREQIAGQSESLTQAARVLAELDVLISLADVAAVNGYVQPAVDESGVVLIRGGRHPVVEHTLADGERFVPNDTRLTDQERMLILTGPNMSGKSVYIRQVALIVLLAQVGSFVPADEAHVGLVDSIFVRAGASDDITRGRSTFLVEMSETGYILRHATPRSLVVLDEVGRGTSTYDGMSIAWAVAEELHDAVGARTLFATHFHELMRLVEHLDAARNYTLAVAERDQQVIFLRQLIPGGVDKSYGIQVARLAGMPERVIARAHHILSQLEQAQEQGSSEIVAREPEPIWVVNERLASMLHGVDEATVWAILSDLNRLDIANITPVQALVALNDLQSKLANLQP